MKGFENFSIDFRVKNNKKEMEKVKKFLEEPKHRDFEKTLLEKYNIIDIFQLIECANGSLKRYYKKLLSTQLSILFQMGSKEVVPKIYYIPSITISNTFNSILDNVRCITTYKPTSKKYIRAKLKMQEFDKKCIKVFGRDFKEILNDCIKETLNKYSGIFYGRVLKFSIILTYFSSDFLTLKNMRGMLRFIHRHQIGNPSYLFNRYFSINKLIQCYITAPSYMTEYCSMSYEFNDEYIKYLIRCLKDKNTVNSIMNLSNISLRTKQVLKSYDFWETIKYKSKLPEFSKLTFKNNVEELYRQMNFDEKQLIIGNMKKGNADVLVSYISLQDNISLEKEKELLNLIIKYKKMFTEENVQYIVDNYNCKYEENKDLLNGYLFASKLNS